MATKFEDIYCLNSIIKKEPNVLRLPIYQYYSLCFRQLQYAITAFMYDCLKDITLFAPYEEQEYNFIGDGVEKDFSITPSPSILLTNIYVGVLDNVENVYNEVFNYTYDVVTNIITFNEVPSLNTKILIAFYEIGSFVADLDIDEKVILSEGMNIPFLESYQNNPRSLEQIIYTQSYKIHSQAEQLKQVANLSVIQWRDRVDDLIKTYSYRKPKDGLVKLSGKIR